MKKIKVLFLCANNSVQSPMAEGLLDSVDSAHFEAHSGGIERGELHPIAIEVMREINIDLGRKPTKIARDVSCLDPDFVITLCDRSKAECPEFPGAEVVHWQFQDPLG